MINKEEIFFYQNNNFKLNTVKTSQYPIFISHNEFEILLNSCTDIINQIFKKNIIKKNIEILNQTISCDINKKPHFLTIDFAYTEEGFKLVELQAFPSVSTSILHGLLYKKELYKLPYELDKSFFLFQSYIDKNTVLLEYEPLKQKTLFDFEYNKKIFNLNFLCLKDIIFDNEIPYYFYNNQKIEIKKIYNRLIPHTLPIELISNFNKLLNSKVEWFTHPDWFYIISKNTSLFLEHDSVPKTYLLDNFNFEDVNLNNYIAKPLFEFGGNGVIINLDNNNIKELYNKNYIVQEKINYKPIYFENKNEPHYTEFRMMFLLNKNNEYQLFSSLNRINSTSVLNIKSMDNNPINGISFFVIK